MKLELDPAGYAADFETSNTPAAVIRVIEASVMGDYAAERHLVGMKVLSSGQFGVRQLLMGASPFRGQV